MVDYAVAASGLDDTAFLRRITDDEQLSLLFAMALDAARRSYVQSKVKALGHAVVSGVLAEDPAAIDEAQLVVATLADLEAPHIKALLVIEEAVREREQAKQSTTKRARTLATDIDSSREILLSRILRERLGVGRAAAEAIIAVLERHGLIQLDPPGFDGWDLMPYALRILSEFDSS